MSVKKKRTAKQIAATKKLIAFNKKRRKTNPVKKKKVVTKRKVAAKKKVAPKRKKQVSRKRVGTSLNTPSMTTKKRPSARLKKRRASNKIEGYYPNPMTKIYFYVIKAENKDDKSATGYLTDTGVLNTIKKFASHFTDKSDAVKMMNKYRKGYTNYKWSVDRVLYYTEK